ncbi:MAG: AMP phosphorylase [Candidatus Micrarchaeota archaeon]
MKTQSFSQTMQAKVFDADAGTSVAILNETDAKELDVLALERVELFCPRTKKKIVAIADITKTLVHENQIGLFLGLQKELGVRPNEQIRVSTCPKPESVLFIRKKMNGNELSPSEIKSIISDISANRLSEIETAAFVSAIYMRGNTLSEIISTTKALVSSGEQLRFSRPPVLDKHSIGGINGRTSMIIVPIIAAAGFLIPKTASRAITSAAGTADAMECLGRVNFSVEEFRRIVQKTNGIIAWGGAIDLAPGDDKIIKIEHPLSLDPEGQVIASVMAKKKSVGAQKLVIDIPIGPYCKVTDSKKANSMAEKFRAVGKAVGIQTQVMITNGNEPVGNAIGPALEARLALEILENREFDSLAKKSCQLAGRLLEMTKTAANGKGFDKAKKILEDGSALEKMKEIIKAQHGNATASKQVTVGKLSEDVISPKSGLIREMHLKNLIVLARTAGAPGDLSSGLVLHCHPNETIEKGDSLLTVYSSNRQKLELALQFAKENTLVTIR